MSDTPKSPEEELLSEDAIKCLEKVIEEKSIKNYAIDVSLGSPKGDNFMGIIVKVAVKGENASGEKAVLNFIVKCAPRAGMIRQRTPLSDIYQREIYIYETLLKEFTKFQESKKISKPFNSFAKYYTSLVNSSNDTLIMEDMKQLGYELQDKQKTFNYDQVLFAVREYGKLHAISFALRDQKPELFDTLSEKIRDFVFGQSFSTGPVKDIVNYHCQLVLKSFDPVKEKVAYDEFGKFLRNLFNTLPGLLSSAAAGKYAVIGHGDCWKNNILFKYEDSAKPEAPTKVCFLDWQISRLGSPALDLSYLIFTSTTKELRDQHYTNLIQEYYNSLATNLRELGTDSEKVFPFKALEEQLRNFSQFGLFMALSTLVLIVTDVFPDIHNMTEDQFPKLVQTKEAAEIYIDRLRGIVLDFVKYNYF